MKHPSSKTLYGHWDKVRGERASPFSDAVDLAALAPILADMVWLDVRNEPRRRPTLTIRLAGTRVEAIVQRRLAGVDLLSLWTAEDGPLVEDLVTTVASRNQAIVAGGLGAPTRLQPVRAEMLLLPIRDRDTLRTQVVGTLVLAERPAWLGYDACEPFALSSERLIDPFDEARFAGREPARTADVTMVRQRPVLTVVHGGRIAFPGSV